MHIRYRTLVEEHSSRPALRSATPGTMFGTAVALALLAGCDNPRIKPDLTASSLPTITVQSAALVGGAVTPETVHSAAPTPNDADVVYTTTNTQLQLLFRAEDPVAGIAKLVVELNPGSRRTDEVVETGALDSNGLAPEALFILGHAPFPLHGVASVGPGPVPFNITVSDRRTVHVSATNFAGTTKEYDVTYVPLDPVDAHIDLSPATIDRGGKALLYEDWHGATDVAITPATPLVAGGVYVSPPTTTTYTMTARQPFSGPMVEYPNANGVGQTVHPTVATSTATLTVNQPGPTPGSTATTAVFLTPSPPFEGWLPYSITWPPQGTGSSGATLVTLANPNTFTVWLVKAGYTSTNCGDSGDTVQLAQGQKTLPSDNATLFYNQALSLNIIACIQYQNPPPANVRLDITYQNP